MKYLCAFFFFIALFIGVDFNTYCNKVQSSVHLSDKNRSNVANIGSKSDDEISNYINNLSEVSSQESSVTEISRPDLVHMKVTITSKKLSYTGINSIDLPTIDSAKTDILAYITTVYTGDDSKDTESVKNFLADYLQRNNMVETVKSVRVSSQLRTVTIITDYKSYTFRLTDNIE